MLDFLLNSKKHFAEEKSGQQTKKLKPVDIMKHV